MKLGFMLEERDNIPSFGHNGNLEGTVVPYADADRPLNGGDRLDVYYLPVFFVEGRRGRFAEEIQEGHYNRGEFELIFMGNIWVTNRKT
jgi:hypothetical protein